MISEKSDLNLYLQYVFLNYFFSEVSEFEFDQAFRSILNMHAVKLQVSGDRDQAGSVSVPGEGWYQVKS